MSIEGGPCRKPDHKDERVWEIGEWVKENPDYMRLIAIKRSTDEVRDDVGANFKKE